MNTYATLQDVRDRGIAVAQAGDDLVRQSLARATIAVDTYCRTDFWPHAESIAVDGSGGETLFLDRRIIRVWKILVDDIEQDLEYVEIYGEAGYLRMAVGYPPPFPGMHAGVFTAGARNVEIHGLFGYERVPDAVREACLLLAVDYATRVASGGGGSEELLDRVRSVRVDDISVSLAGESGDGGGGGSRTTGMREADRLLVQYRMHIEVLSV